MSGVPPGDWNAGLAANPRGSFMSRPRKRKSKIPCCERSGMMWKLDRSGMINPSTTGTSLEDIPSQSVAQNVQLY